MTDDVRDNAVLVLEIGYYDAADARTSGTAIERLANAFAQETRTGRDRHGLELVRVEIASLHAWFDLGKTLLDLYEQRALFGGFLQTVAVALETVMNAGGGIGPISASVRSFLVSLAAPIVRKQASHARIYVKGDNNTIIYIENLQAERIDQLFDAPRRVRRGGGFLSYDGDRVVPRQTEQKDASPGRSEARLPARMADETQATLLNVAGQWYARPAGFQGVMLPVAAGSIATEGLVEARTYAASGSVVREDGNPTVFRVQTAVMHRS